MNSRVRTLLYGISSVMDMVAGTLLFVVPVLAAQLGASYSLIGALGVAWGAGVALMTFVLGRFVGPHNSATLCIIACIAQALGHLALILLTTTPESMLVILFFIGLTHTTFMVPYQVFYKAADSHGKMPLARSVSIYTFAWSLGMAVGPLWSGFLMRVSLFSLAGWQLCLIFTILSCFTVALIVYSISRRPVNQKIEEDEHENIRPDFARTAWLAALCGAFAFTLLRQLFPAGAVRLGITEDVQGGVIFTMGLMQALSGIFLGRVVNWMYKPYLIALGACLGVLGMACFLLAFLGVIGGFGLIIIFYSGAFLFGLYSGSFYFYTGYHCLVHPSKAGFNIAMNEAMYAIANILALFLGGVIADMFGINVPYLLAGMLIIFFTVIQVRQHIKHPWPRQCRRLEKHESRDAA